MYHLNDFFEDLNANCQTGCLLLPVLQLERAIERLEDVYHGSEFEKAKEELIKECEAIWETQKACEMVSLTGNECTLPVRCFFFSVIIVKR